MRIKAICCEVLYREVCLTVARSSNQVDIEFLPKGLHDLGWRKMRERLQQTIDLTDFAYYEALVLGYGLCSNGVVGLRCPVPMILPRAHDCITLFMGGRDRYRDYFNANPGVYFLTTGWIERGKPEDSVGLNGTPISHQMGMNQELQQLIDKYGEDNGRYVYETLHSHEKLYGAMTFIEMGVEPDGQFEEIARQRAAQRQWTFQKMTGDMRLIDALINGPWNEEDFLVVPPGQTIHSTTDDRIVTAGPPL